MNYYTLFIFIIPCICFSQENELLQIINHGEEKQKKIDSLTEVFTSTLDTPKLADYYHNLGSKWHYRQWKKTNDDDQLRQAIRYTENALRIKKSEETISDQSIKKTLYNLAFFNRQNDDFYKAIDLYSNLIYNYEKDSKTILACIALGRNSNTIGDFHKALNSFKRIIEFNKNEKDLVSVDRLVDAYIEIANTYSLMGFKENEAQIQFHLLKADSIILQSSSSNKNFGRRINKINQIKGNRLLYIEKYDEAELYFKKVIDDLPKKFKRNLAISYNSLGLAQLKLKAYNAAMESFHKSISFDQYYSDPYDNLGELYLAKKDFDKAFNNYNKAISYAIDKNRKIDKVDTISIKYLELVSNKVPLLNHIISKANAWLTYYEYDGNRQYLSNALDEYRLADQLVDLIRFESSEYQSRLFWREKVSPLYLKAVRACYLLNKPKDAFYFMEKNKALLLLEDITNEEAKEITNLPQDVAKREFELKRNIALSENELNNEQVISNESKQIISEKIRKHKRNYKKFVDSLVLVFPDYAKFKKKIEILNYNDYNKKFITDNDLVIHYILDDDRGYGLLTTPIQSYLFELVDVSGLNQKVEIVLNDLSLGIKNLDVFLSNSNTIFKNLLPPEVFESIKGRRLTLVTDNILQRIPYETLIVDVSKVKYVIEDVEIRYAYSISHLDLNKKVIRSPQKQFLGFAPVRFANLGLTDLTHSKEEVDKIEEEFSGDVFKEEHASSVNFKNQIGDYKIIHLSTHADIGSSGNPWIAFKDKKIFLKEIYATKTQSDMVVLSGCNTSNVELKKGEGVMSLARGFFYSGAKSVVSSLWSINEKASKDIMVNFYKGLKKGKTKSAALRNAKLDFIKKNKENALSPNLWGALVVIGDNKIIKPRSFTDEIKINQWWWLILFVSFFTAYFALRQIKVPDKKKK